MIKNIKSDYVIQGAHRIHNWYAFAIIGIVFGMAVGIIYVANRNAQFNASNAAMTPTYETTSQYTAPMATEDNAVVLDAVVKRYSDEHGETLPETVTIIPVTKYEIQPGENNDTVELGETREWPFSTSFEQETVRNFVKGLLIGYDIYLGTEKDGWITISDASARDPKLNSDIYNNLAQGMFTTDQGKSVVYISVPVCTCPAMTVSYKDKDGDKPSTANKNPVCNKKDDQCVALCGAIAKNELKNFFVPPVTISPPPLSLIDPEKKYEKAVKKYDSDVAAYLADAKVSSQTTPVCNNTRTVPVNLSQ